MRRIIVGVLFLLLAGCVVPTPHPFVSPLTFDSPPTVVAQHRIYLPLYIAPANKRGVSLACGYEDMERLAREVSELGVSWIWNWEPNPPLFAGVESVPTLWDAADIGQSLGGNSEWLLGFNEPDDLYQANMTPAAAARAWARVEAIYPERKLGSPQVMVPGTWLEDWYAAYQTQNAGRPPKMAAVVIHTYYGNSLAEYQAQVLRYIALAQRWGVNEVWVTEFAFASNSERFSHASALQLAEYIAWLDSQAMITRYSVWTNRVECMPGIAPGGIFDTPLYTAAGVLTAAGRVYRTEFSNANSLVSD